MKTVGEASLTQLRHQFRRTSRQMPLRTEIGQARSSGISRCNLRDRDIGSRSNELFSRRVHSFEKQQPLLGRTGKETGKCEEKNRCRQNRETACFVHIESTFAFGYFRMYDTVFVFVCVCARVSKCNVTNKVKHAKTKGRKKMRRAVIHEQTPRVLSFE